MRAMLLILLLPHAAGLVVAPSGPSLAPGESGWVDVSVTALPPESAAASTALLDRDGSGTATAADLVLGGVGHGLPYEGPGLALREGPLGSFAFFDQDGDGLMGQEPIYYCACAKGVVPGDIRMTPGFDAVATRVGPDDPDVGLPLLPLAWELFAADADGDGFADRDEVVYLSDDGIIPGALRITPSLAGPSGSRVGPGDADLHGAAVPFTATHGSIDHAPITCVLVQPAIAEAHCAAAPWLWRLDVPAPGTYTFVEEVDGVVRSSQQVVFAAANGTVASDDHARDGEAGTTSTPGPGTRSSTPTSQWGRDVWLAAALGPLLVGGGLTIHGRRLARRARARAHVRVHRAASSGSDALVHLTGPGRSQVEGVLVESRLEEVLRFGAPAAHVAQIDGAFAIAGRLRSAGFHGTIKVTYGLDVELEVQTDHGAGSAIQDGLSRHVQFVSPLQSFSGHGGRLEVDLGVPPGVGMPRPGGPVQIQPASRRTWADAGFESHVLFRDDGVVRFETAATLAMTVRSAFVEVSIDGTGPLDVRLWIGAVGLRIEDAQCPFAKRLGEATTRIDGTDLEKVRRLAPWVTGLGVLSRRILPGRLVGSAAAWVPLVLVAGLGGWALWAGATPWMPAAGAFVATGALAALGFRQVVRA